MAKGQQVIKSFRSIVGMCENGKGQPGGVYVLDSNDTTKYHAFIAVTDGLPAAAEAFCVEYLKDEMDPYVDDYKKGAPSQPGALLKTVIGGLARELVASGYVASGEYTYSLAVVFVKNENMFIGRLNSFPVYYLKDKKFSKIAAPVKARGPESLQVMSTSINDGDMLVLGSRDALKNMTELELKSILMSDDDLSLVSSKINLQANKYEETSDPRIVTVKFTKNNEVSQTPFSKRNFIIMGSMALLLLSAFLWGEISRNVRDASMFDFITSKEKSVVRQVIEKVSMPRAASYNMELVYDGLSVPYDVAMDDDGKLYIVDQKEKKGIIRYDPETKRSDVIGSGIDLSFPTGIDLSNNQIYVVDFSQNVNLVYIIGKDGVVAGKIPDARSKYKVSFLNPKAVEGVDSDRVVYVCDRGNNRLLKFDHEGTYLKTITMPPGFREPNGIAITEGGVIYITLKLSGIVGTIDQDSVKEFTIFEETSGGEKVQVDLAKPSGIAVDRKGTVYVADTSNQRIVVADERGNLIAVIDEDKQEEFKSYYPMSVKLGPKGDYVYVVAANRYSYDVTCKDQCNGKIWRFKI